MPSSVANCHSPRTPYQDLATCVRTESKHSNTLHRPLVVNISAPQYRSNYFQGEYLMPQVTQTKMIFMYSGRIILKARLIGTVVS
jgi:hypothetical protein